ncbi:hypothetical protein [Ruminococcus bromii]|uniref:hypothetical protein n=1 Tax=Ruminococcus bromii TaxID=40518 RepID=UPI00399A4AB1
MKETNMYKNVKDTFPKQLIDMIEDENFRIVSDEISDGTITLQFYSPEGQDCYYDIELSYFINQELPIDWSMLACDGISYCRDYDVSEQTMLWLDEFGHGKNGAPYDMKDVYEDFEWVKNRILTLVEIFNRYNKVAINDVWQLSCT